MVIFVVNCLRKHESLMILTNPLEEYFISIIMNKQFRLQKSSFQIMSDCAKNPLVVPICLVPGRLEEFQGLGSGLERCQKSLNDYLDSKRRIFPRFYFVSTDELLSILGSSENTCVQDHMIKVYTITNVCYK